jgi:hypothetical protein
MAAMTVSTQNQNRALLPRTTRDNQAVDDHKSSRTGREQFGNLRINVCTKAQEPAMANSEAAAAAAFDQQLQHARELVTEGRRLLHVANRDLKTGTILVRRSQQRLVETAALFRRALPPAPPSVGPN